MNRLNFNRIIKFLYSIFHYIFIFSFISVLCIVFTCKGTMNDKIIMIFSTLLSILFIFLIYKIIMSRKMNVDNFNYKHLIIIFSIFMVVQVCLGILLRVKPSWDFGSVYNEAVSLTKNNSWTISNDAYFLMYPNNQFYLLILTFIYKICAIFHVTHYVIVGIIANIVFVDISLLILYFCMKRIWNKKIAYFGLILSFFCCAYVTYLPIFYTDTFPLPFTNVMLLIYIVVIKEKSWRSSIIYFALLTISCVFAFELKATAIIVFVAIILHMLFLMKLKKSLVLLIVGICTFVGSLKVYNVIFEKSNILDISLYDRYNYPYTHWVMMGLKTPGGYNETDFHYTGSFQTRKEKTEANLNVIGDRWTNLNVLNHLKHKINFTWNDGTYFSSELLSRKPLTDNVVRNFISSDGQYVDIFKFFTNGFHYSIIVFMIFSGLNGLLLMKKKDEMDFISCIRLSVFGLFLFLLIWETKSKYLVNFLPLIYLVAIDGINMIWERLKDKMFINDYFLTKDN